MILSVGGHLDTVRKIYKFIIKKVNDDEASERLFEMDAISESHARMILDHYGFKIVREATQEDVDNLISTSLRTNAFWIHPVYIIDRFIRQ